MKIYKKKTGIKSTIELDSDYFKVNKVILEVDYAPTKKDLQDGENIARKQYEIQITDDKELKLLALSIHNGATEI